MADMEYLGKLVAMINPSNRHNKPLLRTIMYYLHARLLVEIAKVHVQSIEPKPKKRRKEWVSPYLQRRVEYGHYHNLMSELAAESPELYKNFIRMPKEMFDEIVERVTPYIQKRRTFWRVPLDPGLRVAITLRFLATGNSYKSLQYSFRVAHNTISHIVPETCNAIIAEYGAQEIRLPTSQQEWRDVARGFEERWNLPHCIGAIDGKHIRIRNPDLGGTYFFNYKKFFSIVIMAVVDSSYKFTYVDVGAIGSESDGGVFAKSKLFDLLDRNTGNIPCAEPLAKAPEGRAVDYFLVGDDAFPLRNYLLKPYPTRGLTKEERLYNYRLSRGRRTVENAFGILANRFRVLHTSICLQPDRAESVVLAACCLHNMLRARSIAAANEGDEEDPETHEVIPGAWRDNPPVGTPLPAVARNTATILAKEQREYLKQYFSSPAGSVSWQDSMI